MGRGRTDPELVEGEDQHRILPRLSVDDSIDQVSRLGDSILNVALVFGFSSESGFSIADRRKLRLAANLSRAAVRTNSQVAKLPDRLEF